MGTATVRAHDGQVVGDEAWRTAKTYDLLRLLALSGGPVPIDTLVELFWPAVEPLRGRASLRTAACQIRKVLGADSIVRTASSMRLQDVDVDVVDYRRLVTEVDEVGLGHPATVLELVDRAEALYQGDLDVSGSDCRSLHEAAAQLRRHRVHLLLEAARAAGRVGDWQLSLQYAERAAALETSDHGTRALMRAWFALGETGKPIEAFERLRRHLADEYGVDPAPQTRALYLQLVTSCEEWPPRSTTIGREDQVRQVVGAVTARLLDAERRGGVVWLVGEPGSGRETVARESADTMRLRLLRGDAGASDPAPLELLQDQGILTAGLAATLRRRADARGRILLVPVVEVPDRGLDAGDAVVPVAPLPRSEFRRVVTLALQGRPTPRLEAELYKGSRGLPGLACDMARDRLHSDTLTWTAEGVDVRRRAPVTARLRTALAVIPVALLDLFVALSGETLDREQRVSASSSAEVRCVHGSTGPGEDRCVTLTARGRTSRLALA